MATVTVKTEEQKTPIFKRGDYVKYKYGGEGTIVLVAGCNVDRFSGTCLKDPNPNEVGRYESNFNVNSFELLPKGSIITIEI